MLYMNITNPKNSDYPQRFSYLNSEEGQQFSVNQEKTFGLFQARYDQMMIGTYGDFLVSWLSLFSRPLTGIYLATSKIIR